MIKVVEVVISLLSAIAALAAIIVAIRVDKRASERFERQMIMQHDIARAQVTPMLAVFTSEFVNLKGIEILNCQYLPILQIDWSVA